MEGAREGGEGGRGRETPSVWTGTEETEAGARRVESWVKGFGKVREDKEGATEGESEGRGSVTLTGKRKGSGNEEIGQVERQSSNGKNVK